ncbi:MAG: 50S ribosomal protein L21 [Clostridiales bacterium]|jgi:large subunit ribosomal protein L21|nr:50S ribosomal protein L21 [Clostridiales bacterium]
MYAIISAGGKQIKVQEGEVLKVEKIEAEPGSKVEFPILFTSTEDGNVVTAPGTTAKAEVLGLVKGEKIIVFKYKAKKNVRRKAGHRQRYTEVKILSL